VSVFATDSSYERIPIDGDSIPDFGAPASRLQSVNTEHHRNDFDVVAPQSSSLKQDYRQGFRALRNALSIEVRSLDCAP